ncbi:BTB/POZ and MATH domain-containing protein 3-like [Triticum dicoccoides]|nr:BTB/POZ and MATH domain-containing protein 3-like [Triticum dicoccoides]
MGNTIGSASSSVKQDVPETWSTSFTEGDTAAHNFEVTGFSLLDGMGAGNFVSSSTFFVGGCEWDITFYPDGWKAGGGAHASAYLRLCNGELGLQTNYTLSLLGKDGQVFVQRSIEHTFQSAGIFWGFEHFVQNSKMEQFFSKKHIDDDCFAIRCVLTVITQHTEDQSVVVIPRSDLHDHLVDMLEGREGTNVTFNVGDQLFHAHRCMLAARSSVFKAELFTGMEENTTRHIKVDDMEPAIFQALLHFIYTDTFPHNSGIDKNVPLEHLFVAADWYGLDRLATMCEQRLCNSIDVHTFATTLALAEQHQCVQLKQACLRFMSSHDVLSDIQETDGFKHLISSCPSVVGGIINNIAVW